MVSVGSIVLISSIFLISIKYSVHVSLLFVAFFALFMFFAFLVVASVCWTLFVAYFAFISFVIWALLIPSSWEGGDAGWSILVLPPWRKSGPLSLHQGLSLLTQPPTFLENTFKNWFSMLQLEERVKPQENLDIAKMGGPQMVCGSSSVNINNYWGTKLSSYFTNIYHDIHQNYFWP